MTQKLQISLVIFALALCLLPETEGTYSWWTGLMEPKDIPCHSFGIEAPGPIDQRCDECCKRQQIYRPLKGVVKSQEKCYCKVLSNLEQNGSKQDKQ